MLCERNDDITCYVLFIACIAACEKVLHHELAIASMQRALNEGNSPAFWNHKSAIGATKRAYNRPTSGVTATLEMQAKSFHSVPRSIDTASVQILPNATLTPIVVCDVTVSSHLSTLNFIFKV